MPFDQAIAKQKILDLGIKVQALRVLQHECQNIAANLDSTLDVETPDTNQDGTAKLNPDGTTIFIISVPDDRQMMKTFTPTRRNLVFDDNVIAADAALAKTA